MRWSLRSLPTQLNPFHGSVRQHRPSSPDGSPRAEQRQDVAVSNPMVMDTLVSQPVPVFTDLRNCIFRQGLL